MNPVPLMTLVELIRGQATSPESMAIATELCTKLGKTALEAADYPGFIANRILMPMINEAIYALMEGVGTPEAIDGVMKLGMNHLMGPLTLADFIGLDVCLAILNVLHDGLGDPVAGRARCSSGWSPPAISGERAAAASISIEGPDPLDRIQHSAFSIQHCIMRA